MRAGHAVRISLGDVPASMQAGVTCTDDGQCPIRSMCYSPSCSSGEADGTSRQGPLNCESVICSGSPRTCQGAEPLSYWVCMN